MRARAVTLRPFPVTDGELPRAQRGSLAVATRWWLLRVLIRQWNSAEQAAVIERTDLQRLPSIEGHQIQLRHRLSPRLSTMHFQRSF